MLGLDDDGKFALSDEADDRVIWDRTVTCTRDIPPVSPC